MRKVWLLLLLAPSALVYACGGDDTTDGGADAANDTTTKPDSGGDTGTDAAADTGTDTGPGDSGGDVSITVTCLQPSDCVDGGVADAAYPPADAGVVCCGDIKGNNNAQQCQIVSAATSCKAPGQCATSFAGLVSCSSATVRLCDFASECTEQGNNLCCSAQAGDGGTIKICANKQIAQLSGGKIVCP